MSVKNHEMIIKFDGIELSPEASARIQTGINNLLLQELAGHQPGAAGAAKFEPDDYCGIYIPHKWIGRQVMQINLSKPESIIRVDGRLGSITHLAEG